jgi:hypothetical protein
MCFVSNLRTTAAHLPGYLAAIESESARNLSRIARTGSTGGIQPLDAPAGRKGGGSASGRVFAPSAELEGRAHSSTHKMMSAT